ncbi:MAG TPA: condensation domain-containing protein, partial [Longimicrobium sp.]|nr:condensation domain-containing protein [Longimicrobium sp.]
MRDLERRLDALPPEARRLLELRLKRTRDEAASAPVRRGAERAPLSFAQRRLWFLDRLEPGALYNSPLALRVHGALDAPALERALAEVVRRHQALRSVIRPVDGGEAEQVVLPAGAFHLPADDLSALPEDRREEQAARIVHDEMVRPFDLAAGPLFRARLLRIAADEHVLVLAMHHVVSDGWSLGVLFRELGALYEAFARGAPSPLQPLPLQYADFAAWQREHWTEERLGAQLEWWRKALAGAPAVLEIPADRPRPAVQSHRGARLRVVFPDALAEGVRTLARREGATPFMVMLAAFYVLLSRATGEEDLVVGSPVAGRTRAETEGLIGFFVNTLPLRARLDGDPSFTALLRRVREATLGAYQHQELPFERLVEALHPGRSLSHAPVFQTLFALQNATPGELRLPGVRMEIIPAESGTARFDLEWLFWEREEGITGTIGYAEDLFDAATAERMAGHYRRLLEAVVTHPDARISTLPLLDAAERRRIAEWQAGPALPPRIDLFPARFTARVAEAPDAVALVHGEVSLTRAELDARASRLARHLRRLGVGPEARVAVAMERTPELIVTLLAVLKAGGAYVPMEPHLPPERMARVLADAEARVFVAANALIRRIELPAGCIGLAADDARVRAVVDAESGEGLETIIHPESLSHVIYTSGSTGQPKGVMIRHGSVAALLAWMRERFPLRDGERVLASSSVSFDVHVAEVHFALAAGAPLLLVHDALAV